MARSSSPRAADVSPSEPTQQACRQLWAAVLLQAYEDVDPRPEGEHYKHLQFIRRASIRWAQYRQGTFDMACEIVGMDPGRVQAAFAKRAADTAFRYEISS